MRKTLMYIQEWGTYTSQTMIVVGMNHEAVLDKMKSMDVMPHVIEDYDQTVTRGHYDAGGFVWCKDGKTLLWLPKWDNDEEDLLTLIHETNHLVYLIMRDKGMDDEMEAQAYQQEFLFKHIFHKLNQHFKKGKK